MKQEIKNIGAYEIDRFIDIYKSRLIILDVRSEKEYKEGHIKNAINISYEKIIKGLENINNDKIVLVYCYSGGRSMRVAKILYFKGYSVINVVGGLKEYNGKNIVK